MTQLTNPDGSTRHTGGPPSPLMVTQVRPPEPERPTPPAKPKRHARADLSKFKPWVIPYLDEHGFQMSADILRACPIKGSDSGMRNRLAEFAAEGTIAKEKRGAKLHYGPASPATSTVAETTTHTEEATPAEQPLFTIAVFADRAEMSLADAAQLLAGVTASHDRSK